jgi:hypothetical protein
LWLWGIGRSMKIRLCRLVELFCDVDAGEEVYTSKNPPLHHLISPPPPSYFP